MAHINNIRDADVHFTIDPITRAIKNAASTKTSVIQYDHNSERFTFMLPRYIEGHDMMECNQVEVHYINANSSATSGVYIVDDMHTDETEENVLCSWLLSQNVTQEAGLLHFLLRFACVADDGSVEYAWNTGIYKGMSVAAGMYNSGEIFEQHADVLAKWEKDMTDFQTNVENALAEVLGSATTCETIVEGELTEGGVTVISAQLPSEIADFKQLHFFAETKLAEVASGTSCRAQLIISDQKNVAYNIGLIYASATISGSSTLQWDSETNIGKIGDALLALWSKSLVSVATGNNSATNLKGMISTCRPNEFTREKHPPFLKLIISNTTFEAGTKFVLRGVR